MPLPPDNTSPELPESKPSSPNLVSQVNADGSAPRVIVAITGGIACYKSANLVSQLAQAGITTRVLMTEAATRFVAPLTFQSLSNNPVVTNIWDAQEHHDSQHIALARWCQAMVIAPATTHTIAKLAAGLCDDIVSLVATAIGANKPILLAPAMNADLWANPITQRNLATVQQAVGCRTVGPETGWQACRTQGPGRMAEPDAIFDALLAMLPSE